MSLINEALKRAKEVQARPRASDHSSPPLQPVLEPASSNPVTWVIAAAAVLILFAAFWCFSLWWRGSRAVAPALVASARVANPAPKAVQPAPAAAPASAQTALAPAESTSANQAKTVSTNLSALTEAAPVTAAVETNLAVTALNEQTLSTNATPVAAAVDAPTSAADEAVLSTLKLQGIFYRAARPSALINGQALFIGDQIGGAKLIAVDRQSVRVLLNGRTNVVSMK